MSDRADGFYVMAFNSTSHSIQTEKKAKESFHIAVIPTPVEIKSDCGLALKFLDNDIDIDMIKSFHESLTVDAMLYYLSNEKTDGKRKVEKLQ